MNIMRKLTSMIALSVLLVSMASCSNDSNVTDQPGDVDLKPIPAAYSKVQQIPFAQQSNAFANRLFTVLAEQPANQGKNVCVAPMSMQYMLSMIANGAEESLQREIVAALGFENIGQLNADNLALHDKLAQDAAYVQVGLSNGMWLDQQRSYLPAFQSTMQNYYMADMQTAGFYDTKNHPSINAAIDAWAKEHTNGQIKTLPIDLNILTRLVSVSANYFDAKWASPFDPAVTKQQPFYNAKGQSANVMTMSQTLAANYYTDDVQQMVELPYGQGYFSMIVAMPKQPEQLDSLIQHADWWRWHEQMTYGRAEVKLPRFAISSCQADVATMLDALNMPNVNEATYPYIATGTPLELSTIIHSVSIKVDENGTKAASAAGGKMDDLIAPYTPTLAFDHPFIFAIRENTTGAILFMGKVVQP